MSADAYEYFVEYEQNISLALKKLRAEVFKKGEFNGSEFNPKTPEEALEMAAKEGSIMKSVSTIVLIFLLVLVLGSCDESKTTSTKSSNFDTKQEKIQFLERYLTIKRNYEKLDFYINYHDNSTGMIPGPSDWDICLIAIVPKIELKEWIKGQKKIEDIKDKMCFDKVPTQIDYSKIKEWYQYDIHSFVGIDPINRIVVYRNATN